MENIEKGVENHGVSLRRIPYPYQAMLAICSDLDETPDEHKYFEIMRFLNTTQTTAIGPGVGLDIGNTIYFDMPPGQFSYWNTDDKGREMIRTLIKSGHIDCLHSFGDFATTRTHAERALYELSKYDCPIEVWVDHGTAPSNFGPDIMCGQGDVPGSVVYHSDLTLDFGIQYVWRGRVTSVIGQDISRNLGGIWNCSHPIASTKTLAKESIKGLLSRFGFEKYAMHGSNELLWKIKLRDNRPVYEFMRSNPHWRGVSCGETADGLAKVLVEPMLRRLMERGGVCILYTHLGKTEERDELFSEKTIQTIRLLARFYSEEKILVSTTRRILNYCLLLQGIDLLISKDKEVVNIELVSNGRSDDISGISLYVQDPEKTRVKLNGHEVKNLKCNGPDHTGRRSVSTPWRNLDFPEL